MLALLPLVTYLEASNSMLIIIGSFEVLKLATTISQGIISTTINEAIISLLFVALSQALLKNYLTSKELTNLNKEDDISAKIVAHLFT